MPGNPSQQQHQPIPAPPSPAKSEGRKLFDSCFQLILMIVAMLLAIRASQDYLVDWYMRRWVENNREFLRNLLREAMQNAELHLFSSKCPLRPLISSQYL